MMISDEELHSRLELLRIEHRDLDEAIAALNISTGQRGAQDQLRVARLKKRKLQLKDMMSKIESQLVPDIIA